jgi:response regulator of citrate/malate metabolism
MKNVKINIVIVEDSVFIQERLTGIIAGFEYLNLIYISDNADDAVEFINMNNPEFVILDIRLNDSSGITVLKKIRKNLPETIIIIYTNFDDYRMQCKIMGCNYFIDKSDAGIKLTSLLDKIDSGEIIQQPPLTNPC